MDTDIQKNTADIAILDKECPATRLCVKKDGKHVSIDSMI